MFYRHSATQILLDLFILWVFVLFCSPEAILLTVSTFKLVLRAAMQHKTLDFQAVWKFLRLNPSVAGKLTTFDFSETVLVLTDINNAWNCLLIILDIFPN